MDIKEVLRLLLILLIAIIFSWVFANVIYSIVATTPFNIKTLIKPIINLIHEQFI
jgi:hypothetical protein